MLKFKYTKEEDVPEALKEFYTERDGAWELQVDGMKTPDDVARVHRDLVKERDAHKATKEKVRPILAMLDGDKVTVEMLVERLDNYEALEAQATGKVDDAKIETLVAARVAVKEKQYQRQIKDLETERDTATAKAQDIEGKFTSTRINDAITQACVKAGVDPRSFEDVLMYSGKFTLTEDEKIVTKDDGLTPELWLADLKDRKTWWGPSQGAGAEGGDTGGSGGGVNPWKTGNVTEQARFREKHGDDKAKAMAARAGKDLFGKPLPK